MRYNFVIYEYLKDLFKNKFFIVTIEKLLHLVSFLLVEIFLRLYRNTIRLCMCVCVCFVKLHIKPLQNNMLKEDTRAQFVFQLEEEKCQVYSHESSSKYRPLNLDRCLYSKGEQKEDKGEGKEEEMICLGMPRGGPSRESISPVGPVVAAHLTRIFFVR